MMKTYFKTVVMFISMNIAIQALAEAAITKDGIKYELRDGSACVIGFDQDLETAVIPETIQVDGIDHTVDRISDRAFFNCRMSAVTIPSSVTFIGEKAFYGCNRLTELDIPNSVGFIGENAFEKCSSIERLTISSSLTEIQEGTFYDCHALSSVTIPPSVECIGKSAFYCCHSIESLSLPSSVGIIGEWAFYGCDALLSITIPSSVKVIGPSAFWNCLKLKSAAISSSVTEIPYGMFYGCHDLTNVVIPSSATYIGERAFEQCLNLPLVVLPPSVTMINEDAFKNCEKLTTIVSYPAEAPIVGRNAFYRVPEDAVVYVPAGSLERYPSTEGWSGLKDFRELGYVELTISATQLNLNIDETATLTVEVEKAFDVVIESETWWTSDQEVAVVEDGKVTAVGEGNATIIYTVIDDAGCPHMASCEVFVDDGAGIEDISADDGCSPIEYYNLNGVRVNLDSLAPGIYIRKDGKRSKQILVR